MKGTKISKIFQLIGTVLNGSVLQITCWLKPNTELGPIVVSPSGLTKPCEYTFSTSIQDVSYLKIMLWIYLQISHNFFKKVSHLFPLFSSFQYNTVDI